LLPSRRPVLKEEKIYSNIFNPQGFFEVELQNNLLTIIFDRTWERFFYKKCEIKSQDLESNPLKLITHS